VDRTPVPSDADENLEPAVKRRKVTLLFYLCIVYCGFADPCHFGVDSDPDPDPSIFIIDLQDANKKLIKKKFSCILLFEDTFTSFFEGKKSKRSHKTVEIKVFLTIFA
jgi:hypothetical protein